MITRVLVAVIGIIICNHAQAQNCVGPVLKLSAGMEAKTCLAGASRYGLGISMQIKNKGKNTVHLLLVGPQPAAIDNVGNKYTFMGVSGISGCQYLGGNELAVV